MDHGRCFLNVLVIQTDQYRWDCLGAAGHPDVRTPHLDRLAGDGVSFANSFCTYPVCTPSRYSLLSGLAVRQHGGWSNRATLAPGIETFPKVLRRAGYRTTAVGKLHCTPTYLDVGFDTMELAEQDGDGRLDDDYHRDLIAAGLCDLDDLLDQRREFRQHAPDSYWQTFGAKTSNLPEAWHSTTWIGDHAVAELERWAGDQNLLLVSFIKPHHPFDPPAPWDTLYDPDALTVLPGWTPAVSADDAAYHKGYFPNEALTEAALRRVMAAYYGTISHIDHQIGRLLDTLQSRGLYDDTLIVFTADHGEYLGFHHLLLKGGQMYEPLVRVPLVLKVPWQRSDGAVRHTLVSGIDVAPTILAAAGVPVPPPMAGLNLADPSADRSYIFVEAGRGGSRYAVRSATHKLLLEAGGTRHALYDLRDDPLELHNRVADPAYAATAAELETALAHWALHEAVTPLYMDPQAPQVPHPHQPADNAAAFAAQRQQRLDYFMEQLRAVQGSARASGSDPG